MVQILSSFSAAPSALSAEAASRRNNLAITLAAFLASVGFMVVMPSLPGLIREVAGADLGRSGLWLGLAIGVSPLLTAITGPMWAIVGARYGHKPMIERSLVFIGIGIGLMALASSPLQVVGLRAVIGGLGGVSITALAALTASTPRRELGRAVGALQAAQTAGSMVGPLIGGALGVLLGMRQSFVVSGAIFGMALLLVHWLYREEAARPADSSPRPARGGAPSGGGLGAGMAVALLAAFVMQFVEGGFIVLLPLQVERLGATGDSLPWVIGAGLSATYLAASIAAAVGGRLVGRRSATSLLGWVLLLGLLALPPLALAATWWQFVALRVLLALLVGAGPTFAYSLAATLAPPERRGAMVSLISSAGIFGWAASPLAAGALIQVSPSLLLGLDAGLYALLGVTLWAAERGLVDRLPGALQGLVRLPNR